MNTKNCLMIWAHPTDFSQKLVQIPDDHFAVGFNHRWQEAGGQPWVDLSADEPELLNMWKDLEEHPEVALPDQVDLIITAVAC